jgi:hypothetical protein
MVQELFFPPLNHLLKLFKKNQDKKALEKAFTFSKSSLFGRLREGVSSLCITSDCNILLNTPGMIIYNFINSI